MVKAPHWYQMSEAPLDGASEKVGIDPDRIPVSLRCKSFQKLGWGKVVFFRGPLVEEALVPRGTDPGTRVRMPRARLLPAAGGDVMSKSCSPRLSSARSCMGHTPSSLALVELPFRPVESKAEGRNRLIRNLVNAGCMAAYHRAGLPVEGLAMKTRSKSRAAPEAAPILACCRLFRRWRPPGSACNENPVKTFALMPRTAHSLHGDGCGLPGGSALLPVPAE